MNRYTLLGKFNPSLEQHTLEYNNSLHGHRVLRSGSLNHLNHHVHPAWASRTLVPPINEPLRGAPVVAPGRSVINHIEIWRARKGAFCTLRSSFHQDGGHSIHCMLLSSHSVGDWAGVWPTPPEIAGVLSYLVFMPKPSTHRMHDPGSNVLYIRPKVLTDNQMS
jgi:hypothetical protein